MFGEIKKMCEICRVITKFHNKDSKNQIFPRLKPTKKNFCIRRLNKQ